jgi:hypothetical protein
MASLSARRLIITLLVIVTSIFISRIASTAELRLAWDPNTEPDLSGYRVYYGTAPRSYGTPINVGNVTTYTLGGLTSGQTYFIAVTAYDSSGYESGFSNEVSGTPSNPTETVSTPNLLVGPTSGLPGTPYSYTTGGSSSSLGHSVQYQFDWKGDGTDLSTWGTATQSKTWTTTGTYNVKSRARCATHTNILSNWSNSLSVDITPSPPAAATLISPTGTITTATPTYTWNAVAESTWYNLSVNDSTGSRISQWYSSVQAGCGSGTGTCSVAPSVALVNGAAQWKVQTYNSGGYGPWSTPMSFTVNAPVAPPAATLVSPSGTISTTTPAYTWNAVSAATDFYLWVNDATGARVQQWYTAVQAGCSSGTGTCSVTPATALASGSGAWYIQTKNSVGTGPWSSGMSFTVQLPSPPAATLASPSGTITDTTPTYTWNAVSGATWYRLWVNDSTGNKIQKWYPAADAGCADGAGPCSATPTTEVIGSCQWWIQIYTAAGFGPWSVPLSFTTPIPTPPVAATLISPSGTITDSTPTYRWNAVSNATWYRLWVNDSTGNKIQKWYPAADAGCADGAGPCSVTPTTEVIGSCQWWIQTYNAGGFGPWSVPLSFTTPIPTPPVAATLVSPSGTISTFTPTYTWNAVSTATDYYLWVNDAVGNRIQEWYTAAQAGCVGGTGTCSVTPSTPAGPGTCQWWIQTKSDGGVGPWSTGMYFTIPGWI